MIKTKRVYDPPAPSDGARFLVDRLWPRGLKKEAMHAAWLKDVAPSNDLRHWFNHDPAKWQEFQTRYLAELDDHPEACQPLRQAAARGTITLLFSARDLDHNNALVLRDYLTKQVTAPKKKRSPVPPKR